ncbi:unnamed protein product, partial [Didymodactylos carnosus]
MATALNDQISTDFIITATKNQEQWKALNITEGQASYAQERIWFDKQVKSNNGNDERVIYNMPCVYQIQRGQISVERIQSALNLIIAKHSILRTSLKYDQETQYLKQSVNEKPVYSFEISTIENDKKLNEIIEDEKTSDKYFNLEQGQVFRCHLIRRQHDNNDFLIENDLIIFNFYHCINDESSLEIFLQDFKLAYMTDQPQTDHTAFKYIDYSQYERQLDTSKAKEYWTKLLDGYNQDKQLSLPCDYKQLDQQIQQHQTGHCSSTEIQLNRELIKQMLDYSQKMNITMFQLCLSCYYLLLFKLTQEHDLCTGSINDNRDGSELSSMIGTNTLPYRFQLDPYHAFDQLVQQVKQLCVNIAEFAYLPYGDLIQPHEKPWSLLLPYIQILFVFQNFHIEEDIDFGDGISLSRLRNNTDVMRTTKFDLAFKINYIPIKTCLQYTLEYSVDLFKHSTIERILQRFQQLVEQLFNSSFNKQTQPVYELSLILPFERQLLYELNQTHVDYGPEQLKCIHHLFVDRTLAYSQKVSVVLDQQSLTYSELLYYVQLVSIQLIQVYNVKPQQIICQCLERSIEMAIGILSILTCGAVYAPLNPQDPTARLHSLLQDTHSNYVLIHQATREKIPIMGNIDFIDIVHLTRSNTSLLDEDLFLMSSIRTNAEQSAYAIFTSGSTGFPKAVKISLPCYILDDYLQLIPIKQSGELFIDGSGLFLGYLNRPDLTEQVLIDIPCVKHKCYKTGDLCRLDENGLIHFIGRKDFQV